MCWPRTFPARFQAHFWCAGSPTRKRCPPAGRSLCAFGCRMWAIRRLHGFANAAAPKNTGGMSPDIGAACAARLAGGRYGAQRNHAASGRCPGCYELQCRVWKENGCGIIPLGSETTETAGFPSVRLCWMTHHGQNYISFGILIIRMDTIRWRIRSSRDDAEGTFFALRQERRE